MPKETPIALPTSDEPAPATPMHALRAEVARMLEQAEKQISEWTAIRSQRRRQLAELDDQLRPANRATRRRAGK